MAGRDGQDGRGKWVFGWHLNDTFPASTYYVTKVLLLALNWALKKIENLYLSAVHTRGWPPLRIRNVGMSALPGSWWHLVCVSWPNNKHVKWSPFLADFVGASNIMRKNFAYVKMRQRRVTIYWMALKISIFFLDNFPIDFADYFFKNRYINFECACALSPLAIIIKTQSGRGQTHCPHFVCCFFLLRPYPMAPISFPFSFSFIHTTRPSSVTQNVNDWVSKKRVWQREKYGNNRITQNEENKTQWNEACQVYDCVYMGIWIVGIHGSAVGGPKQLATCCSTWRKHGGIVVYRSPQHDVRVRAAR